MEMLGKEARYGEQSTAKVISAWPKKSSGGTTTYEVLLHEDGILTCSCPGWVLRKTRDCKHVKEMLYEAGEILSGRRKQVFKSEVYEPSWKSWKPSAAPPKVGVGRLIEREEE